MRVERIGHVNIRTDDVAATVAFYVRLLGLRAAPGASASARQDNVSLIHVNGFAADEPPVARGSHSRLNHFALDCVGLAACVARLDEAGIAYRRARIEARALTQLTLPDPNGLMVELSFADETDTD